MTLASGNEGERKGKSLHGAGDVCHPSFVGRGDIEQPSQSVVNGHRWFAAMAARRTLIADLSLDAGYSRQPRHAVRTAILALTPCTGPGCLANEN